MPSANYTGTYNFVPGDIANYTMGTQGVAPHTSPHIVRVGGWDGTIDRVLRVDATGNSVAGVPHIDGTLLFTTATAGTQTTTNAGSLTSLGAYKQIAILLDVTSTVGSTATLTAYIDSNFGTGSYVNVAAFAVMTTAAKNMIVLTKNVATALEVANISARVNAGTVRNVGFGDATRLVYTISGATSQISWSAYLSAVG